MACTRSSRITHLFEEHSGPGSRRVRSGVQDPRLDAGGAFAVETVLTFIFVMVILFATSKVARESMAGLAIGVALVFCHLIGIALTGTSVNPARSIGPALVVGGTALSQLWLFIVAPLVGGFIAAMVYGLLTRNVTMDVPADARTPRLGPRSLTLAHGAPQEGGRLAAVSWRR